MPLIQFKTIEGVLPVEKKRELIARITDAVVAVEGESVRALTWVVIEEVRSGAWGVAGKPLSTEDARAIYAGKTHI
jgi:4-oxalocrotonate tautomerase